jgi:hypothetical protein
MQAVEKWWAQVLLLNSGLALAVSLGLLGAPLTEGDNRLVFGAAMLGFLAAVLALRRHPAGLWGGLAYYAVQVLAYAPIGGGAGWSVSAGLSIGLVLHFSQAVVVVNLLALAFFLATIALLIRRRRHT